MTRSFLWLLAAGAVAGCSGLVSPCGDACMSAVSPDGRNEIRLWAKPLAYEVARDGAVVVAKTAIGLTVDGRSLCGGEPAVSGTDVTGTIETPVYKKARVDLAGREAFADFGDWGVRLAARNDGVAYRFETKMKGEIRVDGERASVTIPCPKAACSLCYGKTIGCEETVPVACAAEKIECSGKSGPRHLYLPLVYRVGETSVAVTESDVWDYPVWNLVREPSDAGVALGALFAPWPTKTVHAANGKSWNERKELKTGGRWIAVKESADWLVKTDGTRTFPWRTFVLAGRPSAFCEADIVTALARAQAPYDFSWVRPGKVAWDWWNAWDNQGEAKGCNTATYKRFIDFAAKSGVEYVILDEGWSETLDIWKFHPNVDVPEIIRYGNEKGVGIILWMAWAQISGDEARVARHFARLGAKGFKVDFMDRGDAKVERFLWKFADACAKNKMLVDYHGAHRPTGMSRAYPNVLNYEGVHGLECMKFYRGEDFADLDVRHFFLRMTAGPLDYTPGAMDNYPLGQYKGSSVNPGSLGTRCRQMAMMALYEAPLQMLSDAPAKYEKNAECFSFMAATPVVWDETVGLGGCPDCYAAVARKAKDGAWYAAAVNNATAREVTVDTSFLGSGTWSAEVFRDAADADTAPTHYVHEVGKRVEAGEKLRFRVAPGGGFAVKFAKK